MKIFLRFMTISFIIFNSLNSWAMDTTPNGRDKKQYPAIFCIDDEKNWTNAHAIQISFPNASGYVFASVYEHAEDSSNLILHTLIENHGHDKKLILLGKNFHFEMDMKTFNFSNRKNSAQIEFKNKKGFIAGEYSCSFSQ